MTLTAEEGERSGEGEDKRHHQRLDPVRQGPGCGKILRIRMVVMRPLSQDDFLTGGAQDKVNNFRGKEGLCGLF